MDCLLCNNFWRGMRTRFLHYLSSFWIAITSFGLPVPNLILIMTNDQGYGDLRCHGNPILNTLSLESLLAGWIRFTKVEAQWAFICDDTDWSWKDLFSFFLEFNHNPSTEPSHDCPYPLFFLPAFSPSSCRFAQAPQCNFCLSRWPWNWRCLPNQSGM